HFGVNLPQLIGPALPLLFTSSTKDTLFWSGITGIAVLSCFKHQEPRFLLPAVPLLLASIKWPTRHARLWLGPWILFNALAAIVFGRYHQAGVVPVQSWIARQDHGISHVFWWKTYSPPRWLLGDANRVVNTTDLMGMPQERMYEQIAGVVGCRGDDEDYVLLVAPSSYHNLRPGTRAAVPAPGKTVLLEHRYMYRRHVGLDDLDWAEDGVWGTLQKVVGGRGLSVYGISQEC
ncbi:alpha 1,2 mannosyltransferase, partial [Teratosphaeriaceae sp. CCFEE 6253]